MAMHPKTFDTRAVIRSLAIAGLAASMAACLVEEGDPLDEDFEDRATAGAVQLVRQDSGGKCLDIYAAGTSNGTKIQQYTCNATVAQEFLLEANSDGTTRLKNPSSGKCIDVNGTGNGAQVRLYTCSSTSRQKLVAEPRAGGFTRFRLNNTSRCLDVDGGGNADSIKVHLWDCHDGPNQAWKAEPLGSSPPPPPPPPPPPTGQWKKANLTWYESYPAPGSEECEEFNGCLWSGYFAFLDGKQSEQWVMAHNIAAVHSKDANKYKLKKLALRQGTKYIEAVVYDMCSDSDCDGCCTQNASQNGYNFLIDIEKYTKQRFGSGSGTVEFQCLDCN